MLGHVHRETLQMMGVDLYILVYVKWPNIIYI